MIALIDYGMGNLRSVANAVERLGYDIEIVTTGAALQLAERAILPGVGAYADCMRKLRERGFIDPLNQFAQVDKKPILGICLGMQVMAKMSYEHGETNGLGWFDAEVVKVNPPSNGRVPHMGWNTINFEQATPMFRGLPDESAVYFVHSYWMKCNDQRAVAATCDYGQPLTAAIAKDNIFATQFHPEKSQEVGLQILQNFLNWKP